MAEQNKKLRRPARLEAGGRYLWDDITGRFPDLESEQLVQLEEACRAKDRLDRLDKILTGDEDTWTYILHNADGTPTALRIDGAMNHAVAQATLMKQLLVAMRLPDEQTGKRPQSRPGPGATGVQVPSGVSSIERARQSKAG